LFEDIPLHTQGDGTRHSAQIVDLIEDHKKSPENSKEFRNFLSFNNNEYEDTMACNDIIWHLEKEQEQDILFEI